MASIKDITDMRVYKLSMSYLDPIYDIAYKIPHLKLRTQLTNSAEAVPPLLSEGFSKRRNRVEMLRFYEMAMAESDEVIVHLLKAIILSKRFHNIPKSDCERLANSYKELSKQINSMIQKLKY